MHSFLQKNNYPHLWFAYFNNLTSWLTWLWTVLIPQLSGHINWNTLIEHSAHTAVSSLLPLAPMCAWHTNYIKGEIMALLSFFLTLVRIIIVRLQENFWCYTSEEVADCQWYIIIKSCTQGYTTYAMDTSGTGKLLIAGPTRQACWINLNSPSCEVAMFL